jgi:AcrR family transcriptional regulator
VTEKQLERNGRPGTAVGPKGRQRVEDILDAATKVLINDGYANFSLRRIADVAGIKLGNLQYYFPIKEDLLDALLKRVSAEYTTSLEKVLAGKKNTPKSQLLIMVDYLLKDQEGQASCLIFWELWALSAREESIAKIMNAYYDSYLDQVANALIQISPKLPKRKAFRHAAIIVSMIEGASLLRGFGKPQRGLISGFEKTMRDICIDLAEDASTESAAI